MAGWRVQVKGVAMPRVLFPLLILALAVAMFAGLAMAQQPGVPKGKTMELTIVATGKDGAPVQGLKQDDITVKDDNRKQEIVSFERISGGVPAEPGKPAIHNLVLIDSLNTPFSDAPESRLAILKVLGELAKADKVTILVLRQDLKVLSDVSQGADSMLGRFAKQGFDPSKADAFNWVFTDENVLGRLFTPVLVTGRVRMEAWIHCLQVVAQNMQTRSGRRNLFWISQYFPPLTFGETGAGYIEQVAGTDNRTDSAAQVSGTKKGATPANAARSEEAQLLSAYAKDIQNTARMLQNANVAIYPLDARYLCRNSAAVADKARMDDMARSTGGLSFPGPKDLAAALHDAIQDTQTVYIARYVMSDSMFNGKDHALKVETRRKDVKLRMRSGYFPPQQPR
jgi:VWFA-related protein